MSETDHMKLTPKQEEAYNLVKEGKNVLITGPGGTGKSLLIKLFRDFAAKDRKIAVTSTTGISALLIGGTTLHSYLGIGLGTGSVADIIARVQKIPYLRKRWTELNTLIIDEISMLSPELFTKLEEVARNVRRISLFKEDLPFGGIQLILSGDFLQLPVVKNEKFCFESPVWNKCIDKIIHLTEIIRQPDPDFQECLNNLRFGKVNKKVKDILNSRIGVELKNDLGIKPTKIHTTNAEVDAINEEELDKLATPETKFYQYDMQIELFKFVKNKDHVIDRFRKNCIAPITLQLCIGAQVMLLWNIDLDSGLANGSRGIVTNFIEEKPVVKFLNGEERIIDYIAWDFEENGEKIVRIIQIPLKVAYCTTVHKSQGCTLDYAIVDLTNIFEYGMVYVALSRIKSKEGLSIIGIDFDSIQAHPKAIEFYKKYG